MRKNLISIASGALIILLIFLGSGVSAQPQGTLKSVKIGSQEWTTESYMGLTYGNGDAIREARTNDEWMACAREKRGCWCFYENDATVGKKYGRLYNWYAITDERGFAPEGWRVPTDDDWNVLVQYLGGNKVAGRILKSREGWLDDGNGIDSVGFAGLPTGYRKYEGSFRNCGSLGYFWSSTQYQDCCAWFRILLNKNNEVSKADYKKEYGFTVRFVK
jgi:uncharacterized protein (TIGR02145 family)